MIIQFLNVILYILPVIIGTKAPPKKSNNQINPVMAHKLVVSVTHIEDKDPKTAAILVI